MFVRSFDSRPGPSSGSAPGMTVLAPSRWKAGTRRLGAEEAARRIVTRCWDRQVTMNREQVLVGRPGDQDQGPASARSAEGDWPRP